MHSASGTVLCWSSDDTVYAGLIGKPEIVSEMAIITRLRKEGDMAGLGRQ